jgi:hypothetical protein
MKTTSTQRNFKKKMNGITKDLKNGKKEKLYSYIENRYISSYFEDSGNGSMKIRKLNTLKYSFIIAAVIFGLIIYIAAPYSKLTSIPFTIMISSIILILFGMIHPSLAFLDGKSRITVIISYGLLFIVGFIFAGITLQ